MKRAFKRGFSLLELMLVISIIAVLLGIVSTAGSGSIEAARENRKESMRVIYEQGLAAYYAQLGEWPDTIENAIKDSSDAEIKFTGTDADDILADVVGKSIGKRGTRSMLLDVSGLYVCKRTAADTGKGVGMDFTDATAPGSSKAIPFAQMAFGYQDSSTGRFRRFEITYSVHSDSVTVGPKSSTQK